MGKMKRINKKVSADSVETFLYYRELLKIDLAVLHCSDMEKL